MPISRQPRPQAESSSLSRSRQIGFGDAGRQVNDELGPRIEAHDFHRPAELAGGGQNDLQAKGGRLLELEVFRQTAPPVGEAEVKAALGVALEAHRNLARYASGI